MDLASFRTTIDEVVGSHPAVTDNAYTRWFAKGDASRDEVRHLTQQFSVFSHLFIEAQLLKVFNSQSLDEYRAGKEILMNELGVIFKPVRATSRVDAMLANDVDAMENVSTEGSVEGSRFKFSAAHFEWLLRFGKPIGLEFADLGKRRHATPATAFFCDELMRVYGNDDPSIGAGASYAVEHWAAAGFWKELITGLTDFKNRECSELNLSFFTWHDKLEEQHAEHTEEELTQIFHEPWFDEEKFLHGAAEMLNGVKAFWDGLEADRVRSQAA